jgi:hypothetical protein
MNDVRNKLTLRKTFSYLTTMNQDMQDGTPELKLQLYFIDLGATCINTQKSKLKRDIHLS